MNGHRFVKNYEDVRKNVQNFNNDLNGAEHLQVKLSGFKQWYYVPEDDAVGPSKFIGYLDMTAEKYRHMTDNKYQGQHLNGGRTQDKLNGFELFRKLDKGTHEYAYVEKKVEGLLRSFGKSTKKNAEYSAPRNWTLDRRLHGRGEAPPRLLHGRRQFPLNAILYGPPGTGKTYATFRRCVEICDGQENCPDEIKRIRARYAALVKEERIEFVTFHQSYGYEEFVEGLRPDTGSAKEGGEAGAGFRLVATPGVLKRIAKRTRGASGPTGKSFDLSERQVFKMSLGNSTVKDEYQEIFDECIRNGYVLLNYGGEVDWSDERFEQKDEIRKYWQEQPDARNNSSTILSIKRLRNDMKQGDLVIVPAKEKRFRAIGEIAGPYEFVPRETGYNHRRKVRWLWEDAEGKPASDICKVALVQRAIYPLDRKEIIDDGLHRYIGKAEASADAKPHVLVIDEINRANVSKVMGELITLLEEDKREGAENEVSVTLPHSRKPFTLPANLYILGTMNTADRSIALLDTALRRRFEFEELTPDPGLLSNAAEATGLDLPAVLRAINERLEYLIGRDHLIGHAWLMGARTKADVDRIMRHKIIPLIAEYFYDDWRKVRAVLGGTDDFIQGESLVWPRRLGDDTDAGEDRLRWTVQKDFAEGAYDCLISGRARDSGQARDPEQAQGSGQAPDTEPGTD